MDKSAILWSAATAFIIGLSVSLVAAIVEAKGEMPSGASWLVCLIGAGAVAAKDVRSLMKLPPINTGDTTMLTRAVAQQQETKEENK